MSLKFLAACLKYIQYPFETLTNLILFWAFHETNYRRCTITAQNEVWYSRGSTKFLALQPLGKTQNSIINCIFPSRHKERNLRLNGSILGLTPVTFRAKSAAFFMVHRLRQLPPPHPISVSGRTLYQYPIPFPLKGYSVLLPLQNHNLLKLYLQTHPNAIPPKPLSPKTFILSQALQVFYSDPNAVLPKYISPECCFDRYSYDSIIRITDNQIREFGFWGCGAATMQ